MASVSLRGSHFCVPNKVVPLYTYTHMDEVKNHVCIVDGIANPPNQIELLSVNTEGFCKN
jgi:hypothetical protein